MSLNSRDKFITSPIPETQEKLLLSILDKNDNVIFFDIGACEGESSIRYSRLFPDAIIYTFEPLPSNFELVKKKYGYLPKGKNYSCSIMFIR